MKKLGCLLLAAAFLLPGHLYSQIDPVPDGIGMYADRGATTTGVTAEVGEMIEVYLILTRPSVPTGIAAWECGIVIPANVVIWGYALASDVVGAPFFVDPPFFCAGYHDLLPPDDIIVLMSFNVCVTDSEPAVFYVREHWKDSAGLGVPVYATLTDNVYLHPLHTWPGGETQPAFTINDGSSTQIESSSWGGVKALYR